MMPINPQIPIYGGYGGQQRFYGGVQIHLRNIHQNYHFHRGIREGQQTRFPGKPQPTPRETRGQRGVRLAKTLSNNTPRAKFRGRRFDVRV